MKARQSIPGVHFERDVVCATRDGVSLATDVYRPESAGSPLPVLLMRLPYGKSCAETLTYLHPAWYARQGFIVAVQDVRGRFASDGVFEPFVHEGLDGYDAVEWAASLPGTTGEVGMYGFSYAGITQLAAATLQPPHLSAIAPAFTSPDYYQDWFYPGGVPALAFPLSWALALAAEDARRAGDAVRFNRLRADLADVLRLATTSPLLDQPVVRSIPFLEGWLSHPLRDPYWTTAERALVDHLTDIRVPALFIDGLYDTFAAGAVRAYQRLQTAVDRCLLVMGPWQHMPWRPRVGDLDFGSAAIPRVDALQVRWFHRWLGGPGIAEESEWPTSRARVFVMGENEWMALPDWPSPDAPRARYYLHSGGAANTGWGDGRLSRERPTDEPVDMIVHDPFAPVQVAGGQSCCLATIAPMGPRLQEAVEAQQAVCVYRTDPETTGRLLVGMPHVRLYLSTDADELFVHVRLCWAHPDGRSYNLSEGTQVAHWPADAPDRHTAVDVVLGPIALRLAVGERLHLHVALSAFPSFLPHTGRAGKQSAMSLIDARMAAVAVLHDRHHAAYLDLPVEDGTLGATGATTPWEDLFQRDSNPSPQA